MTESASLLIAEVLSHEPIRQRVLSVPLPLGFRFASQPKIMGKAPVIAYRTLATHLTRKAGSPGTTAHTGAVTFDCVFNSITSRLYLRAGDEKDNGGKSE